MRKTNIWHMQAEVKRYIDTQILTITQYLLERPSLNKNIKYRINEIIDIPIKLTIESNEVFSAMSSAYGVTQPYRAKFFEKHPMARTFMKSLGPNRLQFAILVFNFIFGISELRVAIARTYLENYAQSKLLDLYQVTDDICIKIAIFKLADRKTKSKIILMDDDPKIRKLRHNIN